MGIGILLAFVFAGLAIGLAIGAYKCRDNGATAGQVTCIVLCILAVIGFLTVPFSMHTVDTGNVAVVKELGKIVDVREPGTHFDFWMTKSYQRYDTKVQNVEIATTAYSSDAQTMEVAMTVQYQIMADKVTDIAKQYLKFILALFVQLQGVIGT